VTNVSPIGAGSDERFLALVRRVHPDGDVSWRQVRDAIAPHLAALGVKESKGRINRVRQNCSRSADSHRRLGASTNGGGPVRYLIAVNALRREIRRLPAAQRSGMDALVADWIDY